MVEWTVLLVLVGLHVFYLIGDRSWWGEAVAIWPPIGWFVLSLPSAVRFRSLRVFALSALLVLLHGEWPRLAATTTLEPTRQLRVATWNVSGDHSSWEPLASLDLDLVFVQEHAGAPRPAWKGYEWLATADPALLSRLPLRELPTRAVGPWTPPQLALVELPEGRRLLLGNVRLVLPSMVTWVAGGFGGSPREGFEARVRQYPQLAALVAESMAATGAEGALLCGDFNAPARLPSFAPLNAAFVDVWKVAGQGWGGTATADLPLARIDQCWTSANLRPRSARVLKQPVSDHRLLLVELALPER